ncbi:hypothetical protein [Mesorhizobium sp. J428]|uniref:hypothetical protein n=1 Tax=Mesorhizobium sp. J428 TaxID=2898440 RepID=UPI0021509E18|nr:hypothetical protein [Mesorhizobium sp. J428]MCR5856583.1 hypothetical protein [Mesorhizobium sp. J428]
MQTIREMLFELQESLAGVRLRSTENLIIEIWTYDGRNVAENGKGVKLTIPFKSITDPPQEADQKPQTKPRRRVVRGMGL